MGSYAIPINIAVFTAVLVSFPPFRWHHSLCFLLLIWHSSAGYSNYFNITHKDHTEKLLKGSEDICLTFYFHILQQ